jgi:hypothetical protein
MGLACAARYNAGTGGGRKRMRALVSSRIIPAALVAAAAVAQTPFDFARAELRRAAESRRASPALARIAAEYSMALPPDGFWIQPGVIRGGSRRGLLYGLLEAAGQVEKRGAIWQSRAEPRFEIRGARLKLSSEHWELPAREWRALFEALSHCRMNRLRLEFDGLTPARVETLGTVAAAAGEYAVDLAVSTGETEAALLARLLAVSPVFRAVEADAASAPAVLETLAGAGRLVDLETGEAGEALRQQAHDRHVGLRRLGRGAGALWQAPAGEAVTGLTLDALEEAGAAGFELVLPRHWAGVREEFAVYADLAFKQVAGTSARRSPAAVPARRPAPKAKPPR